MKTARYGNLIAILLTLLMLMSSFAAILPGFAGAQDTRASSRVDTESNNDDINGADTLTSGVQNSASLLVSSGTDVQDWFKVTCNRGQVINTSVYHIDWNPADPGQYNLNIALLGPEEDGSNNYVIRWFSSLKTRYETGSALCAFSAPYFVVVLVNTTSDNPPQIATDPTNYYIDITVADPPTLVGGNSDQKTLSADSGQWFQWYKITTNADQVFNVKLTNPNGGNIDMDMFGLWQRGFDSGGYQGYQPFFLNLTRNNAKNGNVEQMAGLTGDLDVYVRLWLREGTGLGPYTLQVQNALIPSDGNNIPADATLIEKTSSIEAHGQQSVDKFDWYKFNIDAGFTVDLTFSLINVKSSYWNVTIWDNSLNYVDGWFNTQDGNAYRAPDPGNNDPGNVISSAGINKMDWTPPSPGTYYIMVMSIAGDPVSNMRGPPLADQNYRLFVGLPNYGPKNMSQISGATIKEDEMFSGLDLEDYFSDPEGDPLSYGVSDDSKRVLTKLTGSNITATPDPDWSGTCNITVEATDGGANIGANTIYQTFKLTVDPVNDDPFVIEPFTNFTMDEGDRDKQTFPKTLPEIFGDIDSALTYSFSGNSKISVRVQQPDQAVYFSSLDMWYGQENITFTAKDEGTNVAKVTVNVKVRHKNHAPILAFGGKSTYDINLEEDDDANTELNVADMFDDPDLSYTNDELTYALKDPLPLHLNITILEDNTLSVLPEADWSGDAEFKVQATDKLGVTNETTIFVTVDPVNDAPEIKNVNPSDLEITMDEGDSEVLTVATVIDIDNEYFDIRYKWTVNNMEQTDENVKNHVFTFVTVNLENDGFDEGVYSIKCEVTDGELTDTVEWTITVMDVNLKPTGAKIISPIAGVKYKVGKPITFEADTNATDPDGDPLYYRWVDSDSNTTLYEDSAFTLNWKDKDMKKLFKPGTHKIDLYISDGRGGEVKTSLTITIKAKADAGSPGFEGLTLLGALALVFVAIGRRKRK